MNIVSRQCLRIFRRDLQHKNIYMLDKATVYKSAYTLENLYPKSSLKISTPNFVPEDPNAKFSGYIPINKLQITYSCSSGAGGQNVNRINTKVDLRFKVQEADWLSEEIREKLIEMNKTKLTKEGYLIIKSELTRSQQLNLADALEKLRAMIRKSLEKPPEPSPEAKERWRKLELKAARQRLHMKRARSQIKRDRQEG